MPRTSSRAAQCGMGLGSGAVTEEPRSTDLITVEARGGCVDAGSCSSAFFFFNLQPTLGL